jgi:hypothetical protein
MTHIPVTSALTHIPLCLCQQCRRPMKLIRSIPQLGAAPELLVFYCRDCDEVEGRDVAAA